MLTCSGHDHGGGGHHGGGATTPECRAGDTPWLTTLAYCINSTCPEDIAAWKLEKYWVDECTGDPSTLPKWSYQEALNQITEKPTEELSKEDEMPTLNYTALYNQESWEMFRGTLNAFARAETNHSKWGIIVLVVSFGTPILLSVLGYLPYMTGIIDKLNPRLIYPQLIGTYHVRALPFSLGNAPTTGHTIYIVMFVILNIIATAVGYPSYQPGNMYFASSWEETMGYVAARTGVLAFALAPLVVLFSGRNNMLLWLTNWSHSTYMLLHRWVARIFTLQVILHSILEYMLYKRQGILDIQQKDPFWIWGIVGTIACVIMVVVSTLYFRRLSYEIFLISHILLAIFVIAGSWYHVEIRFTRKWGYELWLYAACAVWFLDRLLRLGRVLKNGIRRSEVVQVSENIVRIDVKNLRWDAQPGMHTYAYFPTLNPLRPWENHPFSVIPTALLQSRSHSLNTTSSRDSQHSGSDIEKSGTSTAIVATPYHTSATGISLFVRKSTGMTHAIAAHSSLITLLDGPYPNNHPSTVLKTDRLILIVGGIGITGALPFIAHHQNVKLFWSIKTRNQGLVDGMSGVLGGIREKEINVGSRNDLARILEREEEVGWARVGVVVCGPGAMCDEVRSLVAKKGKSGKVIWELDVEAFSW
jgi:predicted ferric reductase